MVKDKTGGAIIEKNWILKRIANYPRGSVLDFGSGPSAGFGREFARMDFKVTCIDLKPPKFAMSFSNLKYIQGDILAILMPEASFDIIVSNSSIEHAGLGRYGDIVEMDQDLRIMQLFRRILIKPVGVMFLTIPVGIDTIMKPYHRIYGKERLPKLLEGWKIVAEQYWKKTNDNIYHQTDQESALNDKPTGPTLPRYYAEGLFVLEVKQ